MSNSNEGASRRYIKFEGSWPEPHLAAYGCWYITSGDVVQDKRSAFQLALSCMFGPAGLALKGGTAEEVEVAIAKATGMFKTQVDIARSFVTSPSATVPPELLAETNGVHTNNGHTSSVPAGALPLESDDIIPMD